PAAGAVRDDADLAPLPPVATTVQDVLRGRERPDDGPEDTGDAAHGAGGAVPVEPPPAAEAADRAGRPIGPGDLPAGGVGLTGTGAFAAARGIAAAVLLSAGPWQHAGFAQLITTGADLHTLLGPAAAGHQATPTPPTRAPRSARGCACSPRPLRPICSPCYARPAPPRSTRPRPSRRRPRRNRCARPSPPSLRAAHRSHRGRAPRTRPARPPP